MTSKLIEIAYLAEAIAEENITKSKVNLNNIARKKKITIIYGHYQKAFLGELVHEKRKFYLHVNLDLLSEKKSPRTRFTISHEYGHFFIDDHRNKLMSGVSLSHSPNYSYYSRIPTEIEANHFASHLLMPKTRFIKKAKKLEPGLNSVLSLKDVFDTSMECTSIHYINLDVLPCMFIKWKPDLSYSYSSYSQSFSALTGIKGKPIIRINKGYLTDIFDSIDNSNPKVEYVEEATTLSNWVATIPPGSKRDLIGLEQTFKWGDYGGFTFLVFPQ